MNTNKFIIFTLFYISIFSLKYIFSFFFHYRDQIVWKHILQFATSCCLRASKHT